MIRHWTNMFVAVAPDCPVETGVVPVSKRESKPAHVIQYELLSAQPYQFTFEEQLFEVYLKHKGFDPDMPEAERSRLRDELLAKSHPCMRASQLPKKYGWGVHYNDEGRIAIYGMETEAYQELLDAAKNNDNMELQTAVRSSRKTQ
ncbi:hypothetical protein D3P07_00160 [Paenibacillus sp. 1011MAR3C5]|uniref:DUF6157 family protein n=1 Tax=Paenibacillus sp. 1011MAR3C5 TaxID=1675787 RepID=UPI000E6D48D1|nr:DUF6157 family protein [Paenibacillus sp. 1011MAR3C5]RJE90562.1 hypothetical protein D3P07_00160 [Paenibacillus sp. 1011MAR3C5]